MPGRTALPWLGQRDVLAEECPRRRGVHAVVHVGGPAHGIAREGRAGHDVGLASPGAQEVRPARIPVARATIASRGVHRDAQPGRVHRVQPAGGHIPDIRVVEGGALVNGHRLGAVADRGEPRPGTRLPSEPAFGSRAGVMPVTGLSRTTTATSCGSLWAWL